MVNFPSSYEFKIMISYDFILPFYRALKRENAQHVQITAFQDDHSFLKTRLELAATVIKWIKTISENQEQ